MRPRIILAGGSGFVGQALTPRFLEKDYDVVVLTRGASSQAGAVCHVQWDGKTIGPWAKLLERAHAIINLTGRTINCRHTPQNQREIIESRVDSVRVVGEAITRCSQPPQAFVQAVGVGIYGDSGDRWCDENSAHGTDFVADVCKRWEEAFDYLPTPATRKVLLRLGVALGPEGGFLKVLSRLTRLFLGGQAGNGRQFISWIHIADLTRMFVAGVEDDRIAGVFNATAPNPVTNTEFMRELRRELRRPWSPPVPEFAVRLGASLIGTEPSLALTSQRATPKHFLETGFQFDFTELRAALNNIYPSL